MPDTITFQVNRAYHQVVAAHKGIERARPAVEDARASYRLIRARYRTGDATTSDIVTAESTLTRAEQEFLNSQCDYRTALSQLEYAMGVTPIHTAAHLPNPIHMPVEPEAAAMARP